MEAETKADLQPSEAQFVVTCDGGLKQQIDKCNTSSRVDVEDGETLLYSNSMPRGLQSSTAEILGKYFRIQDDEGQSLQATTKTLKPFMDLQSHNRMNSDSTKKKIKFNDSRSTVLQAKTMNRLRGVSSQSNQHLSQSNLGLKISAAKQDLLNRKFAESSSNLSAKITTASPIYSKQELMPLKMQGATREQNWVSSESKIQTRNVNDLEKKLFEAVLVKNDYFRLRSLETDFSKVLDQFSDDFSQGLRSLAETVLSESYGIAPKEERLFSQAAQQLLEFYQACQYKKCSTILDDLLRFIKRFPTIRLFHQFFKALISLRLSHYESGLVQLQQIYQSCQEQKFCFGKQDAQEDQNSGKIEDFEKQSNKQQVANTSCIKLEEEPYFSRFQSFQQAWFFSGYLLSRLLRTSNNSLLAKSIVQSILVYAQSESSYIQNETLSLIYLRSLQSLSEIYEEEGSQRKALGVLDSIPEINQYYINLKNYTKAQILIKMDRTLDAINALENSHLGQNQDLKLQSSICWLLSQLYKKCNMLDKQEKILNVLQELVDPNHLSSHGKILKALGVLNLKIGQDEIGLRNYVKALEKTAILHETGSKEDTSEQRIDGLIRLAEMYYDKFTSTYSNYNSTNHDKNDSQVKIIQNNSETPISLLSQAIV